MKEKKTETAKNSAYDSPQARPRGHEFRNSMSKKFKKNQIIS